MCNLKKPSGIRSFADICSRLIINAQPKSELTSKRKQGLVRLWFQANGPRCPECNVQMKTSKAGARGHIPRLATVDHIKARALGGTNQPENLRVVCYSCNNTKSFIEGITANKVEARSRNTYRKAIAKGASEDAALARASQTRRDLQASIA